MPAAAARRASAAATGAGPSKKRQRQSASPAQAQTQPPRPVLDAAPDNAPSPAPVLSAVAIRKAAAAAAAAASAATAGALASTAGAVNSGIVQPSSRPSAADASLLEQDDDTSSSDSASEVEAALVTRAEASRAPRIAKHAGKGKKKDPQPSRYFSGPTEDEMRIDLSDDEPAQESQIHSEAPTPKAARPRRRREKTAFVDPECYSNLRLQEGVNAWPTKVARADGSTCDGVVFGLRIGEDLVIHGVFDLVPLSGSISLLGSTLSPSSISSSLEIPAVSSENAHRVFSPASHPVPPIASVPSDPPVAGPSSLSLYLDAKIDISGFAAVVLVAPVQTGIEGIEACLKSGGLGCANAMFPVMSQTSSVASGQTWRLVIELVPGLALLRQIDPWHSSLSLLVPARSDMNVDGASADPGRLVIMVEGQKRVGKSTFSKMLLNKLLDRYDAVAYLDTDLGQPEFSTPGFVSLNVLRKPIFGPAFTHLSLPVSSHYLGSTSPASDPASYESAIAALLSTYALEVEFPLIDEPTPAHSRRRHRQASPTVISPSTNGKVRERVPLVINTQGWVKGLGADLLAKLKEASRPTHVCSFVSVVDDDMGAFSDGGPGLSLAQEQHAPAEGLPYQLYTLPGAPTNPLESKWTASDYRTLSLVSYFHSDFVTPLTIPTAPESTLPASWDFSAALVARTPFNVNWTREAGQISTVHLLDGDDIGYEHVLHALNGSLVAIVESTSTVPLAIEPSSQSSFPYDPFAPTPSPLTSRAIGLGLVRSIAPSTTSLHVLTPIPTPSTRVSLVKGSLEVPLAILLDHHAVETEREQGLCGENWKDVPFLSIEDGEGAGRRRVRRNVMRRGHA
ncbi:polynucleotide 5'-hydroxyl-kinase [Sporobolomyces koalae]|uniref:polynucleotide 5'-hydroxyl-kinase n=1 Tax=Sporobolomyces koalae TaxID=500713 RepID=UPI00316C2ADD